MYMLNFETLNILIDTKRDNPCSGAEVWVLFTEYP